MPGLGPPAGGPPVGAPPAGAPGMPPGAGMPYSQAPPAGMPGQPAPGHPMQGQMPGQPPAHMPQQQPMQQQPPPAAQQQLPYPQQQLQPGQSQQQQAAAPASGGPATIHAADGTWTEHKAPDGRFYYFNKALNKSVWVKPTPVAQPQASTLLAFELSVCVNGYDHPQMHCSITNCQWKALLIRAASPEPQATCMAC